MQYSTRQAAKELSLHYTTFHKYLRDKKIPLPELTRVGGVRVRLWNEADLERARKLLPKIANGRKTRWQRRRQAGKKKQTKVKKAPARAPVPHKKRKRKKKR